jgi:hypothetical protein
MLKQDSDPRTAARAPSKALPFEPRRREAPAGERSESTAGATPLPDLVQDQLAREFADIESASATLRKAEPALESWTGAPALAAPNSRPVWLLVGLLWLSTALVAASAVIVIAVLAG